MANHDRISELYRREIGDPAAQDRARDRVHWMVRATQGVTLDVGCSQGISTLLAAREGRAVMGVDIEEAALERARDDRAEESAGVQDRCCFVRSDGAVLPVADHSVDTVILGEVIEHLLDPAAVLAEVARVLRPGGVVALTTPFGHSPHHDHCQTFYVHDLLELLGANLRVVDMSIVDGYFRVTLTSGLTTENEMRTLAAQVAPVADAVVLERERDRHAVRLRAVELNRNLQAERQEVRRIDAELRAAKLLTASARDADRLKQELQDTKTELKKARAEVATERRAKLAAQDKAAVANWEKRKIKARKGWRLSELLAISIRRPAQLIAFPLRAARILRSKPFTDPRPPSKSAPAQVQSGGASTSIGTMRMRSVADGGESRLSLAPRRPVRTSDLRVALIADEMTSASYAPECELVTFRTDNWRDTIAENPPHLLLVESAWQGNSGAWQYQVGSYSHKDSVGLPHLRHLVEHCRESGVPTVFWNKEDPVHFDKFSEAARLFDVVLTSDELCVPRYQALGGAAQVGAGLAFAAQPVLHNPVNANDREAGSCFAGTYYRNRHVERQGTLEALLDGASHFPLTIFDRTHGQDTDSFGFPDRFAPHVRPGVPYDEIIDVYRRYRVFLNTNSVTNSPTMFSRRVFELLACGTPVVSTPSSGMAEMIGEIVQVVEDARGAQDAIRMLLEDDAHWAQISARGIRRVMAEHTYADRLVQIAGAAGIDVEGPPHRYSLLVSAGRLEDPGVRKLLSTPGSAPRDIVVIGEAGDVRVGDLPTAVVDAGESARGCIRAAQSDWVMSIVGDARVPTVDEIADATAALRFTQAEHIGPASDPSTRHTYCRPVTTVLTKADTYARFGPDVDRVDISDLLRAGVRGYSTEPVMDG